MAKAALNRRRTTQRSARRNPPRSFTCPPELWEGVVAYARTHNIQPSAAVRLLLTTGLRSQRLAEARAWQIEQGTHELELMERGDLSEVSRDTLTAAYEEGRRQLLRRPRARRAG